MVVFASSICFFTYVYIIFDRPSDSMKLSYSLLSSSFIGSSPNLYLSAAMLGANSIEISKAQIMDWIGSSFVFLAYCFIQKQTQTRLIWIPKHTIGIRCLAP